MQLYFPLYLAKQFSGIPLMESLHFYLFRMVVCQSHLRKLMRQTPTGVLSFLLPFARTCCQCTYDKCKSAMSSCPFLLACTLRGAGGWRGEPTRPCKEFLLILIVYLLMLDLSVCLLLVCSWNEQGHNSTSHLGLWSHWWAGLVPEQPETAR